MSQFERQVPGKMIDDPEIRSIADACCDGYATEEQRAKMGELILASDDVRDYFIAHSLMVSQLVAIAGAPDTTNTPSEADDAKATDATSLLETNRVPAQQLELPKEPLPGRHRTLLTVVTVAASIAILVFALDPYFQSLTQPSNQLPSNAIGEMRRLPAEGEGADSYPIVSVSRQARIKLDEGEYEVTLNNGVSLTVAGPGSFVLDNPMYCRLVSGRLTANVPDGAEGFRVDTDDAEIVDHGTRFGVAVDPKGGTNVAVFEGKVEVASGSTQRQLLIGRAVSVAGLGQMSRMQVVKPDSFQVSRKFRSSLGPTITSVRDNIRSNDELGYYRIVHEGFDEDQPAYVDRVHEWNGVDKKGLPRELVGADYILPFNGDKKLTGLKITVTLARKANIYVLLDARVPPPSWLTRDFAEQELSVGMDEGERPGKPNDPRKIAKGTGKSIDYRFSVWKRRKPGSGKVTFGELSQIGEYMSMYGILAVPISEPASSEQATISPTLDRAAS